MAKTARVKKKEWACHDAEWLLPGRKTPIAYSTLATKYSIEVMADEYPMLTIHQLREKLPYDPEARKVLQQYIDAGHGNQVANEWFSYSRSK